MIFTRPAGAVMIFTGSRNAAVSDNSMYCLIPDPFPAQRLVKGRLRQTRNTVRDFSRDGPLDYDSIYGSCCRSNSLFMSSIYAFPFNFLHVAVSTN